MGGKNSSKRKWWCTQIKGWSAYVFGLKELPNVLGATRDTMKYWGALWDQGWSCPFYFTFYYIFYFILFFDVSGLFNLKCYSKYLFLKFIIQKLNIKIIFHFNVKFYIK